MATKLAKTLIKVNQAIERKKLQAYHGTPHEVDKFDSSKIGTGMGGDESFEGAGLFFNEKESFAKKASKLKREDVDLAANELKAKLTSQGFRITKDQSAPTSFGQSHYIDASFKDQYGRTYNYPFRISDHSVGTNRMLESLNVSNMQDIPKHLDYLTKQRDDVLKTAKPIEKQPNLSENEMSTFNSLKQERDGILSKLEDKNLPHEQRLSLQGDLSNLNPRYKNLLKKLKGANKQQALSMLVGGSAGAMLYPEQEAEAGVLGLANDLRKYATKAKLDPNQITISPDGQILYPESYINPLSDAGGGNVRRQVAINNDAVLGSDTKGEFDPQNLYHATNRDFDRFSNDKLGEKTAAKSAKVGTFLADIPLSASAYNFVNYFEGIPEKYVKSGSFGPYLSKKAPKEYEDILNNRVDSTYSGAKEDLEEIEKVKKEGIYKTLDNGDIDVDYQKLSTLIKKYAPDSINSNINPSNLDDVFKSVSGRRGILSDSDKAAAISSEILTQRKRAIQSLEVGDSPMILPLHIRSGKQNIGYGARSLDETTRNFQKSKADTLRINNTSDGGPVSTHYVVKDPKNIRSKYAAFDPQFKDSSNLLGQATTKQLSGVAAGISTLAAAPLAYKKFRERRDARVKGAGEVALTMAHGTANDMLLSAGALGTKFRHNLADGFKRQGMSGAESFVRPEQSQEQFYNENELPQYMPQTEEGIKMIQGLGNVMTDTVDYWKDKPLGKAFKSGARALGKVEDFANQKLGEDNVRSIGHVINLAPF